MTNDFGKRLRIRIFLSLFSITIFVFIFGLVALNNINVAENVFGWNEYQMVAARNHASRLLPLLWVTIFGLLIGILILLGIRNRIKSAGYWFLPLILLPLAFWGIGSISTLMPFDRDSFRTVENVTHNIAELQEKNSLKGQDVELVSFSIHLRNVTLQSGVYAVARVINPANGFED